MLIGAALVAIVASSIAAEPPHRRAVLIGINDYTASRLGPPPVPGAVPERDWPNLSGAVNDVHALADMLVLVYGFDRNDITTLTDQAATREAILHTIEEKLIDKAAKDDLLVFYYSGHGSQVKNSLSEERDKLDESIVPADSRIGARDIRDKELRAIFNRILDRGARLTLIFDDCHSGSAARGLASGDAHRRAIKADNRDVAERTNSPRPEDRGALVLSASQDYENAWETRDVEKKFHGTFSWALLRSMRDAAANEPAVETFLRAQARMRGETPFQDPVLAGDSEAKLSPLFGTRIDRRDDRPIVAISKVQSNGTVILQGGWANGLTPGTQLRAIDTSARLTITSIRSMAQSEARAEGATVRAGMLAEVVSWAPPANAPLRVWMPQTSKSIEQTAEIARSLCAEASEHGVRWITDPIETTPSHLLRQLDQEWELLNGNDVEQLRSDAAAVAAVSKLPAGSSLFVQFAMPVDSVEREGVVRVDDPADADYMLVARYARHHLSCAWLRPSVKKSDRRKNGMPLRTKWIRARGDVTPQMREAVARLRRVHVWNTLESPPGARFPYQLGVRRARDGELARDSLSGGEKYVLVLRVKSLPLPQRVPSRFIYAFVIDSEGKSTLLFPPPETGSVENRFQPSTDEVEIGESSAFEVDRPYGVDTYVLLSTDEPLPDPAVLEWDGVRSPLLPSSWSIEKVVYESLPPRSSRKLASGAAH